jgi:hypothetical protein
MVHRFSGDLKEDEAGSMVDLLSNALRNEDDA